MPRSDIDPLHGLSSMPNDRFHIFVESEYFSITSSMISIKSYSDIVSVGPKSSSLFGIAIISTNLNR